MTSLRSIAREKNVSAYVGDGARRWSAANVLDVAHVYRLALESPDLQPIYHAVGEEGISLRDIAEAVGRRLNLPTASISQAEADGHFGFFGKLVTRDLSATSQITRQSLGWSPSHAGLVEDITSVNE